jgi:hypothetical protein
MNKNKITSELLENRMKARGHGEDIQENEAKVMKAVLDHYEIELTDTWEEGLEYYIYPESTQDGYEVYVATNNPNNISINEDIHYYDGDLSSTLCEAIRYANRDSTMFVDDLESNYITEAMQSLYEYVYDIVLEKVTEKLINEGYDE